MQEIYFDNSATTKVSETAAAAALMAMGENYGNPSSLHGKGLAALQLLEKSRLGLGQAIGVEERIIFTSCGSEANNMVLLGAAEIYAQRGRGILLSAGEHPSLLEPAKYLAAKGYDVGYLPLNEQGIIDLDELKRLLNPEIIFLGLHQVNNESGALQPLAEAGQLLRAHAPQAHYHIDAVQALGKLPIEDQAWQADSMAFSGHKIHGPKGIGALWLRPGRRLPALILGGGQERNLRSGTENLPGIAAFGVAAKEACCDMPQKAAALRQLKLALAQELLEIEGAVINGPAPDKGAPHILNISFPGVKSEVLLHYLEQEGVYVSAGSACSARKTSASHVLSAMGLSAERLDSALRFSFSVLNTMAEIPPAAKIVRQAVAELRGMTKTRRAK